jgi:hypothetical protein
MVAEHDDAGGQRVVENLIDQRRNNKECQSTRFLEGRDHASRCVLTPARCFVVYFRASPKANQPVTGKCATTIMQSSTCIRGCCAPAAAFLGRRSLTRFKCAIIARFLRAICLPFQRQGSCGCYSLWMVNGFPTDHMYGPLLEP